MFHIASLRFSTKQLIQPSTFHIFAFIIPNGELYRNGLVALDPWC